MMQPPGFGPCWTWRSLLFWAAPWLQYLRFSDFFLVPQICWGFLPLGLCLCCFLCQHCSSYHRFFFKKYLFIFWHQTWLHQVLVVAGRIFSCSMWDLVPRPGIKPSPLHWACRPPRTSPFFRFHQGLHWTTCSPFCPTTFCHFSGYFIIPSFQTFLSV